MQKIETAGNLDITVGLMMPAMNIKLKPEVINATYRPYLMRYDNRYEVYYGGAGSGKSHFIAQK